MLSIVIPVWNQGYELRDNFINLINVLREIKEEYEIIILDDGSTDNTFNILQGIQKQHPYANVIRLLHKRQHQTLYEGFKIARGDIIITMDADQKVDPKHIPELLNKLKEGYDMVVTWRAERPGVGIIRRCGSLLINHYTNFIIKKRLHDHACSLKAYRGQLIKKHLNRPELRKFFGIWIARYAQKIAEIKVACKYKDKKDSSFNLKELIKLFFDFIASSISIGKK